MKTVLSSILSVIMMSFTVPQSGPKDITSSEQMALHVLSAFQQSSVQAYTELFPTLQEFHTIMEENAVVYGEYLTEAKEQFAAEYESMLIPSLKESFDRTLSDGKNIGINWNTIRLVRVESPETPSSLRTLPFTIVFSTEGKEYHLHIEKVFVLHEQWKVSQFIKLV